MTIVNTVASDFSEASAVLIWRISAAPRCFEIEKKLKGALRHPGLP